MLTIAKDDIHRSRCIAKLSIIGFKEKLRGFQIVNKISYVDEVKAPKGEEVPMPTSAQLHFVEEFQAPLQLL